MSGRGLWPPLLVALDAAHRGDMDSPGSTESHHVITGCMQRSDRTIYSGGDESLVGPSSFGPIGPAAVASMTEFGILRMPSSVRTVT